MPRRWATFPRRPTTTRAIDIADTDYVCLLHDDDVYGTEFISRGIAALSANPGAALFAVNYGVIDGNDRKVRHKAWHNWRAGTLEPAEYLREVLSNSSVVHISAAMMRTALARQCRMVEADGNCSDMGYFFQLGGRARVILCDEPLVSIRIHQAMISSEAGFVQGGGKQRSPALALAPLEWATKRRFLNSPTARQALGNDLDHVRVAAARRAIDNLRPDLRGYPISERLRILRAIVAILPYLYGARR